MAGKRQRGKATLPGVNAQFLLQLANQGGLWRFSRFNLAAWKFPKSGHRFSLGALCQKHTTIRIDQGNRRDKYGFHER